jgi:hypothetical protein
MLLKNQEFISFQILQHMIIIMSIAKGRPRLLLIRLVALSGLNQLGIDTPIGIQQFLAKGHLRTGVLIFLLSEEYITHKHMNPAAYAFSIEAPSSIKCVVQQWPEEDLVLGLT